MASAEAIRKAYESSSLLGLASWMKADYYKYFLGLRPTLLHMGNIVKDIEKTQERVMDTSPPRRRSREEIRIDVNAGLLQEIKNLQEENAELKRKIQLLTSKKKADYIK